jgi:UDP-N-acetylglucosamine acyltransferase
LKRRGFSADAITQIKRAYKTLYRAALTLEEANQILLEQAQACPEIQPLVDFLAQSARGIVR